VALAAPAAFFSYSREDSEFALKLAADLKAAGAKVWLDQLDIHPGDRWDRAVEDALIHSPRLLVILSPASVNSTNVMDEVSFALEEKKTVIPVMHKDCTVPFRLRRVHYADFRQDYACGLRELLKIMAPGQGAGRSGSAISDVEGQGQSNVPDARELQRETDQARLEDEHQKTAKQTRLQQEDKQAAEQPRVEQDRRRATEGTAVEGHRRKSAEKIEGAKGEQEQTDRAAQKKVLDTGLRGALRASKFEPSQIVSRTIRRPLVAGALVFISVIGSWLVLHYRSSAPQKPGGSNTNEPLKPATDAWPIFGKEWKARISGTEESLQSIFATADGKRLWAVGGHFGGSGNHHESWILRSDDGGEHWIARKSAPPSPSLMITGTDDGKRLWATSEELTLLESDDGGEHWNERLTSVSCVCISVFGTSDGKRLWVGGLGAIHKSVDGGEHWQKQRFHLGALYSISGTSDGKKLWAVGNSEGGGATLKSDDGGDHWDVQTGIAQNHLKSIFGTSDGKRLWAVGEKGSILASSDGGEHWNSRTCCDVLNNLNSVFGTSDGKRLWVVGDWGTILQSDDGGEHWNSRVSGTANGLNSIFGTSDGTRLWAVGEKGTVLEPVIP
jgi:photosystem II stability/assembly factor-like uncharacterized protein